jgi:hypothetical protein
MSEDRDGWTATFRFEAFATSKSLTVYHDWLVNQDKGGFNESRDSRSWPQS